MSDDTFEYGVYHVPTGKRFNKSRTLSTLRQEHSQYSWSRLRDAELIVELLKKWNQSSEWIYYPR